MKEDKLKLICPVCKTRNGIISTGFSIYCEYCGNWGEVIWNLTGKEEWRKHLKKMGTHSEEPDWKKIKQLDKIGLLKDDEKGVVRIARIYKRPARDAETTLPITWIRKLGINNHIARILQEDKNRIIIKKAEKMTKNFSKLPMKEVVSKKRRQKHES